MSDFDWQGLAEQISPARKNPVYAFNEVQDQFRKVAFDVYKRVGDPTNLWELRDGPDGKKYLFALYEDRDMVAESGSDSAQVKKASVWVAVPDSSRRNVTLSCRGTPICRFAGSEYGFDTSDAVAFADFIQKKAEDSDFVNKLVEQMPDSKRAFVKTVISGD